MSYNQIRKTGIPVKARRVKDIREVANAVRKMFFIDKTVNCPITSVLELFGTHFFPDYSFEVVDDNDPSLKGKFADTKPAEKHIRIKESVYNNACNGDGHARYTVAHEFGHLFLEHEPDVTFAREMSTIDDEIPPFRSSEWQADAFAAELLMPKEYVGNMTVEEICEKFGVSYAAAETRRRKLNTLSWQ